MKMMTLMIIMDNERDGTMCEKVDGVVYKLLQGQVQA